MDWATLSLAPGHQGLSRRWGSPESSALWGMCVLMSVSGVEVGPYLAVTVLAVLSIHVTIIGPSSAPLEVLVPMEGSARQQLGYVTQGVKESIS